MNGTVPLVVLAILIVSARTRVNAIVFGQPVSMPVLWLVAAALVLLLAALVLVLLRLLLADGLRIRPRMTNP